MKKCTIFSLICAFLFAHNPMLEAVENPFGPGVRIFEPSMSSDDINNIIHQIYSAQRFNEFGNERYAFLFMPGEYGKDKNVDVRVGYYTQVLGMGDTPNKTVITGAVRTQDAPPGNPNQPEQGPGCLTNFWRSCENLAIIPTLGSLSYPDRVPKNQNVWAVSQASPLRRVRIMNGSLRLYDLGYASGGFLADSRIDGQVISGTQQQWLTRNTQLGSWNGSNWNMVFSGVLGTIPQGNWPNPPYTITDKTLLIKEKPYLFFDSTANQFAVKIRTQRRNVAGTDWHIAGTTVPLSAFYIAKPTDTAATLNNALNAKKHLLFTPGVYNLEDSIVVKNANTILFGLGHPSLTANSGKPALIINDVEGVQVAGLMLDAGPSFSNTLLLVGESTNNKTHKKPVFLYDIFCRVGGMRHASQTDNCVIINSNDVVADNLWLWRADHGSNVGWTVNRGNTGIVVNGNNVIIYGLMVEHFQEYQTIWNGENGIVYQYQSEIPYDIPNQAAWKNGNINGFASYKIANNVVNHKTYGMGIYCYFRDGNNVVLDSGIEAPANSGIKLLHIINFWLSGQNNTSIKHIVNNTGNAVTINNRRADLVSWP